MRAETFMFYMEQLKFCINLKLSKKMKKIYTLWLIVIGLLLAHVGYSQAITNISQHLPGKKMSSITFNSKGIGVATSLDQGFFYSFDNGKTWTQESTLKDYRINQVVADVSGTFWLATTGTAVSGRSATLGGIKSVTFDANKRMTVTHFFPQIKNGVKTGIPSRYVESIATEPSGGVFSAHNYDALVAVGPVVCDTYTDPNGIQVSTNCRSDVDKLFNGGGLGMKMNGQGEFSEMPLVTNIFQTNDIACYPRGCSSVLASNNEVWIAINNFAQTDPLTNCNVNVPSQILTYTNTNGKLTLKSRITNQNTPSLPLGTNRVYAMHQSKNRYWIGFNANKGLAVYDEDGKWAYFSNLSGCWNNQIATINPNAIFSDPISGKVFFGTSQGLIVFRGNGFSPSNIGSYDYFNKTSNNLGDDNILGGYAKNDTVWVTTNTGMYKFTLPTPSVRAYHVKRDKTGNITSKQLLNTVSLGCSSAPLPSVVSTAADGTASTLLALPKKKGHTGFKVSIVEDPNRQDYDTYGNATIFPVTSDSMFVAYTHPIYQDKVGKITIQIDENIEGKSLSEITFLSIDIVRPPLLLLHGVWSNGKIYESKMIPILKPFYQNSVYANPSYPNDISFVDNIINIKNNVALLLLKAQRNGISAGKVDIIAHSMGGILSRLYYQSSSYEDDVNKLITLNTPHFGSQMANLVTKEPALLLILDKIGKNPFNGALYDLRVSNPVIDDILNRTSKNFTYTHSIITESVLNEEGLAKILSEKATGKVVDLLKIETGNFISNKIFEEIAGKIIEIPLFYAFKFGVSKANDLIEAKIFNNKSDLIVSISSQDGGITGISSKSYFDISSNVKKGIKIKYGDSKEQITSGISHIESYLDSDVIGKINLLLSQKNSSPFFSTTGYQGKKILPPSIINTNSPNSRLSASLINFKSPQKGINVKNNQIIKCELSVDGAINRVLISISDKRNNSMVTLSNQNKIFDYQIPNETNGRVDFTAVAFDSLGRVTAMDSTYIMVQNAALLESIEVYPTDLQVFKDNVNVIEVTGKYNDGTSRIITDYPSIKYSFLKNLVTIQADRLKGLKEGIDTLTVSLSGKTVKVPIEVLPFKNLSKPIAYIDGIKSICKGDTAKLTIKTDNGNEFQWQKIVGKDTITLTTTQKIYSPNESGIYRALVKNTNGIIATPLFELSIIDKPTPVLTSSSKGLCTGSTVSLSVVSDPSFTYQWYRNDTLLVGQIAEKFISNRIGKFKIKVSNVCGVAESETIAIIKNDKPTASIVSVDTTIQKGGKSNIKIILTQSNPWNVELTNGMKATIQASPYTFVFVPDSVKIYTIGIRSVANDCGIGATMGSIKINVKSPITATEPIPATTFAVFYPNPVDKVLLCQCPVGAKNILIYGTDGKLLMQQSIDGSSSKIDVSKLAGGLYVYVLQSKTGEVIQSGKFLKQ
jgi:pimeloyl-ACP methyl ester carboxylesterase